MLIAEEALSSDGYFKLKSMLEDIPFLTNEKEFRKIAEKDNDHVAVIFKKYQEKLDENNPHVVLVNPSDQGNLGNIMRSMAAFSFKDLAILIICSFDSTAHGPAIIIKSFFILTIHSFRLIKTYIFFLL